jgi:cation-transporting P-type ATPase C
MLSNEILKIKSKLPGRIRYAMRNMLWRQPERAAATERALATASQVHSAVANPLTGSLLIYYDPQLTNLELERVVLQALASFSEPWNGSGALPEQKLQDSDRAAVPAQHASDGHGHDHSSESPQWELRNLFIGGSVLAGLLAVNLVPGLGFLAAHPLTFAVTSLATLVSGYSFFSGAWDSLTNRGNLTTDTLVSSATIASLALGESGTALIVIWLLNLGEYLENRMLQRARRAIRALLESEQKEVWLVSEDVDISRPVDSIRVGDVIAAHVESACWSTARSSQEVAL